MVKDGRYVSFIHWVANFIPSSLLLGDLDEAIVFTKKYLEYCDPHKGNTRWELIKEKHEDVELIEVEINVKGI